MSATDIKELCYYNRFPENPRDVALLLIYTPIGIVFFILRTFLALLLYFLSFVLPDFSIFHSIVHKLTHVIFGLVINVENVNKKTEVDALISNKVSHFDAVVVNFVAKCVTPGNPLNKFLSSAFGIRYFKRTSNAEEYKKDLKNVMANKVPIFFQPESIITSGRGLLKFNAWPFTTCNKVQPIAISVSRPGLDIPITTIDSTYWSDLFFFMFVPCTVYKVKFLAAVEKKDLTETYFIETVRETIADALKVEPTNYSSADLKEYLKLYRFRRQRGISPPTTATTNAAAVNPQIHEMTLQVKEVLPLVPYNVIYRDLVKTRSVDVTITNLLEGLVPYVAEPIRHPTSSLSSTTAAQRKRATSPTDNSTAQTSSHAPLNTAASVFGKSPQERTLSFQERKRLLIENSKRKYIEKHGLNIVGS